MPKESEIEKLLKSDKLKVLKPNECGIISDEKAGVLVGVCNKDGEFKVSRIRLTRGKASQQRLV